MFSHRGCKNRSLYVEFWRETALHKGENFLLFCLSLCYYVCNEMFSCSQDMQVLSKVETSLNFNKVLLRPEAKNFTQVASLTCRGELSSFLEAASLSNIEADPLFSSCLVPGIFPDHGQKCISHISIKIMGNKTTSSFPGLHITHRSHICLFIDVYWGFWFY